MPSQQPGMMSRSFAALAPGRTHPLLPAFALGVAALGAVLKSETAAASYAWSFGLALAASAGGLVAALTLFSARAMKP
jgi:hypothetical protein